MVQYFLLCLHYVCLSVTTLLLIVSSSPLRKMDFVVVARMNTHRAQRCRLLRDWWRNTSPTIPSRFKYLIT